MRKLLIILVVAAAIVGGAVLVGPSFLPIAQQGDRLKEQLLAAGLRLEYDGTPEASLSGGGSLILTNPRIYESDSVAGNAPLLKAPSASIFFDPATVFSGTPVVSALEVRKAEIALNADGILDNTRHPAWKMLALPLKFEDGLLRLRNQGPEGSREQHFTALNGWIALRSASGPLEADLSFTLDDHAWNLAGKWSTPLTPGQQGGFSLKFGDRNSTLNLEGTLGLTTAGGWEGSGHYLMQTSDLWPTLRPLSTFFRHDTLKDMPATAFKSEGSYQLQGGRLNLNDVTLTGEETHLQGKIAIQTRPTLDVRTDIQAKSWNLDPLLSQIDAWVNALRASHAEQLASLNLPGWDAAGQHVAMLPAAANVQIHIKAEQMQVKSKTVGNAVVTLNHTQGNWVLQEASGNLPGAERLVTYGRLSESAEGWRYKGRIEGKGQSLRQVFDWLTIPLPTLPDDRMQSFAGSVVLDWAPNRIQLSNVDLKVDETTLAGAFIYTGATEAAGIPSLQASIRLNQLDLDRYFPPASLLALETERNNLRESLQQIVPFWLAEFPLRLEMATAAGQVTLRAVPMSSLQARFSIQPNQLVINSFNAVADQTALQIDGTLSTQARRPELNLNLQSGGLTLESVHAFLAGQRETLSPTIWRSTAGSPMAWKDDPLDAALMRLVDGTLRLRIQTLTTPDDRFDDIDCSLQGTDANWKFSNCRTQWKEGYWQWAGTLNAKEMIQLNGQMGVSNLNVKDALGSQTSVQNLSGKLAVNASFQTSGTTLVQLLQGLQLNSNFVFTPLHIDGFDLGTIAQKVVYVRSTADVANLSRIALSEGDTDITTLKGIAYVKDGILQIPASQLQTNSTEGNIQCAIDLPRLVMRNELAFKVRSTLAADIPPLTIRWQGAIENPERTLDTKALDNYVANQSIQRQFR